jgi:hypothetical protein
MSNQISVVYNGNVLYPVPFVTQDYKFIDYNGNRWGNVLEITLNGILSGINSTGNVAQITNIFATQFGNLQVYQGNPLSGASGTLIYNWPNVIINEISFPQSHYYGTTAIPYVIKAHSFNVPSGVTDPSNQYSFTQNEDGTVDVSHQISAKGIRNSTSALNNAVNFVQQFTGKQPFQNCATQFVPSGSGLLISLNEKIDRANGAYMVTEQYKYSTGFSTPYTQISDLTINDSLDQTYLLIDYNVKFKGSPVYNNISALNLAIASGFNEMNDISGFGVASGLLVQITSEIIRNSGDASIEVKYSYYSGYTLADLTGFFDYNVTLKKDLIIPKETWEVKGEYTCRGPIIYRLQQLNAFKQTCSGNYRNMLLGLISGAPIWTGFHTSGNLLSNNAIVSINENTGMATFEASLTVDDGADPTSLANSRYEIQMQPGKWEFELMPAANIEGHYIVQDLQMQSQSKINISLSAVSQFPASGLPILSGYLSQLSGIYLKSGFMIESQYQTGINDLSCESHFIGQDNFNTGLLNIKMVGSNNFNFVRSSGFSFGY